MLNRNTKPNDQIFSIIGERVIPCIFNFFDNDKFCKITLPNPTRSIFKQITFCFNSELLALEALEEKLEYSLACVREELSKF